MKTIRWATPALADLDVIQDYIAQRDPAAAFRLVDAIFDRIEHLAATPEIGRTGRVKETRELVLPNIGYVIAYRIRDDVEILAVMHGARDWPEDFD